MSALTVKHQQVALSLTNQRRTTPRLIPVPSRVQTSKRCKQFSGHLVVMHAKRASPEDEKLIEAMKQDISKGDLWENDVVSTLFKVLAVGIVIGAISELGYLIKPMFDNTINSFPQA